MARGQHRRRHQRLHGAAASDVDHLSGRPMRADIQARHTSRSSLPAPTARWQRPPTEEVETVPAFTGAPEQLWRIDELIDGTYRIMPKAMPNSAQPLALTAIGASTPALIKFDPKSDKGKWNFRKP